jgi:tetratricopeptide (TPR) repeat protein
VRVRVRRGSLSAAAILTIALLAPAVSNAQTWREVKGDNFTVISDASERRVRSIAWQFEQLRSALAEGLPWTRPTLDRPVVVIAARDERSMRSIVPEYWERRGTRPTSVFVGAPDAYYIALRADVQVDAQLQNPHAAAYWSYSAIVIRRALPQAPLWFVSGLAAVLSNTIVRTNEVEFGRPQPWMAVAAKEGPRLPLNELFSVDHSSPYYQHDVNRERFDAQSWAVVQYLLFGDRNNNSFARFGQLVRHLMAGVPSSEAVTAVYGSVDELDKAYLLYVHQGVYGYARLPTNTAYVEEKLPAAVATPAEHMAARAALHAAMNRPVEARAMIDSARKAAPSSASADVAEALLLDRAGESDALRSLLERAVAGGTTNYWPYYRLATLEATGPMTPEKQAKIEPLLVRATTLNPKLGQAWGYLADIQSFQRKTDEALQSARRAVELDYTDVMPRLRLTRLLVSASRVAEARTLVQETLPMATPQQRQLLEQAIAGAN